jgi:hypothetical protein
MAHDDELALLDGSDGELLSPQQPAQQPLPSPAAAPGPAGALARRVQPGGGGAPAPASAHAYLFSTPAWSAALAHVGVAVFDAAHPALAPGCGALGSSATPEPDELRAPRLLAAIASIALTSCGDASAQLADPSGTVDALLTADVVSRGAPAADDEAQRVPLAEGAVLLLQDLPLLAPSVEPRRRAVLVMATSVVAAWPAGVPRAPLALPAPRPRQQPQPPPPPPPRQLVVQQQPPPPVMPPPPPFVAPPLVLGTDDLSVLDAADDDDDLL